MNVKGLLSDARLQRSLVSLTQKKQPRQSRPPSFVCNRPATRHRDRRQGAPCDVVTVIPQLEKKGFPRIDPLHDGRPVPLVKKFYDGCFGITAGFNVAAPDGG